MHLVSKLFATIFLIGFEKCVLAKTFDSLANLSRTSYYRSDIVLEWTRELFLPGKFEIKWFSNDSTWLIMEMSAETEGYVSVGFSPDGGMQGSDIVLGWVDSKGIAHLKDMYAVGDITPIQDTENNYELVLAHQIHGRTTIRFRRKWETCDTRHDFEITDATTRLIYAWHDSDPLLTRELLLPKYHGPYSRGTQSVYLKSVTPIKKFPDEISSNVPFIQGWDLHIGDITVDSKETSQYCKISKAPPFEKFMRVVGFRPLLEDRHKEWVHRITVYECNIPSQNEILRVIFDRLLDVPGKLCHSDHFPKEWLQYCISTPVIWSTGAEGLMLPDSIGISLKNKPRTYFILQVQYNNPKRLNLVRDNSGVRLSLSDERKLHDVALMSIGNTMSPLHIVPPGASKFTTMGYCVSECTKQTFPPEGITITHAMLNGNQALRKISLRHIRSGVELTPITQDSRYDFRYKQFRVIEPGRKVLPGDILMAECEYNSSWNEDPIFGGFKEKDETCIVYIYYYPKVNLSECRMQLQLNSFINAIGIRQVQGEILEKIEPPTQFTYDEKPNDSSGFAEHGNDDMFDQMKIIEPSPIDDSGLTMDVYLRSLDWRENKERLVKHAEEKWLKGKHWAICTSSNKKNIPIKEPIVSYPKFLRYRPKASRKCRENNTRKATANIQYPRVRNYGYFN